MAKKNKILIVGDSWGCGEWHPKKGNSHRGFEYFLKRDKFEVTNKSRGGATLEEIIEQIKSVEYDKFDFIFAFLTDTTRTITLRSMQPKFFWQTKEKITVDLIKNRDQEIKENFYTELNKLNVTVHLLGGNIYKIDHTVPVKYNNLKIAIPSIMDFLNKKQATDLPLIHFRHVLSSMPTTLSREVLKFIIDQDDKWQHFTSTNKFFLLDYCHPDRKGHHAIYKFLKKTVLNDK